MNIRERVEGCIRIEQDAADIYREFMARFPAERAFFEELHKEEIKHASLIRVGELFEVFGEEADALAPPPLEYIEKTLAFTQGIKDHIRRSPLTLEDALRLSLTLEESVSESFMNDLRCRTSVLSPDAAAQCLYDDPSHVDKITRFMIQKKFLHNA